MYKHIKVLARPNKIEGFIDVIVVEQTHIRYAFGEDNHPHSSLSGNNAWTSSSAKINLRSFSRPRDYGAHGPSGYHIIYLRGDDKKFNFKSLTLAEEVWSRLKVAIEEYNEYYKE